MTAHDGIFSSSPLKTATSTASFSGPSVSNLSSLSGAMHVYLTKYCDVVTGGRVVFQGFHTDGWLRFKCHICQDNWCVKADLFSNAGSCPTELQDWLALHKHVCHKFTSMGQGVVSDPKCTGCGWGLKYHPLSGVPLSELKKQTPFISPEGIPSASGQLITLYQGEKIVPLHGGPLKSTGTRSCSICEEKLPVANGSSVCDECYKTAKAARSAPKVKISQQGRMFRKKIEE